MPITDITTFILSILFLTRGASRGFMKSLMGPFSIIVATVISIIYYQATKNMIISLLIGLLGPIFLNLLLNFLLKTWAHATNTDIKPNFLSSLSGAILTLIWGWVFIFLTLILLSVLPSWGESFRDVRDDVMKSKSYLLIQPYKDFIFAASKQNDTPIPGDSSLKGDVKSLAEDPRFQKILQDPEIKKDIEEHDLRKLMSNPKMMTLVQQIMGDPEEMKKVFALYKSQAQPTAVQNQ